MSILRRRRSPAQPELPAPVPRIQGPMLAHARPILPRVRSRASNEERALPSPALAMLAAPGNEDFEGKEWFGGSHGEMLPSIAPQPSPPPQPRGLEIEPPPWQAQLEAGEVDLAEVRETVQRNQITQALTAIERIKLDGDDVPELPPWAPPLAHRPLADVRPRIPEPDWRQEELDRLAREQEES